MHLKKNYEILRKKSHSKMFKNEPENISQNKITLQRELKD